MKANWYYKEIADINVLSRTEMIVTATHTHTAPFVSTRPGSHPDYISSAAKKAAAAVRDALDGMQPGELFTGITRDNRFCFNRRYWMKNGTVVTNPGKMNPDTVRPEGEVDYEIPLIGIKSEGQFKIIIANIVNHTDTIGNSSVSADWAGFFIRRLESELTERSMVMPIIGASGNINHFDVSVNINQTCYEEARRIGSGYADTVKKALSGMRPVDKFKIFTKNSEVICVPREIPPDELADARLTLEKLKYISATGTGTNLTSEDFARRTPATLKYFAEALIAIAENKNLFKFNLVGIFMGSCCLISLPAEPFVEIGLQIKKSIFPQYNTLVASHSNGTGNPAFSSGYIPNSWNYGRGGYETAPRSNPFSVKTADLLLAAWREIQK